MCSNSPAKVLADVKTLTAANPGEKFTVPIYCEDERLSIPRPGIQLQA